MNWIVDKDPEQSGRYLCYYQYAGEAHRQIGIVKYEAQEQRWQYSFLGITVHAWMPLPAPPKV